MEKKLLLIVLIVVLVGIGFAAGSTMEVLKLKDEDTNYIPGLKVIGDVKHTYELRENREFKLATVEDKGNSVEGIFLEDIVKKSEPLTEDYKVLLVGLDNLIASLEGDQLEDCYIYFSKDSGWSSLTKNHPVNSRIKELKEIVIVAKSNDFDYGVNIVNPKENLKNITPGQLYLDNLKLLPHYDGKSIKDVDGKEYFVELYKTRKVLPIKEIVDDYDRSLILMAEEGDYEYIDEDGYFVLEDNTIDYIDLESREYIKNIKGIIIDPPSNSIMNVYHDTLYYLENNEKVLIVFVDGLGYHQYKYGLEKGYLPYLKTKEEGEMALSVYRPVTNAGFAAMITGQPPKVNGVYSRKQKDLKVTSIFGEAEKLNKRAALIEGSIKILNTEIEPILNVDKNKNNETDDEVFESALNKIDEGVDLLFVHFHSVDDKGHSYGDLVPETMDTIKVIDGYIKELSEKWDGKVIITADHGMHKTSTGGIHGYFRYEDLIVPYITFDGGS